MSYFPLILAASPKSKVANYENFLRGNYCSMSARVLFLWDYLVTFGEEVKFVWGRKSNAATVLFMLNRYVNLVITILELIEQAPFQTAQCAVVGLDLVLNLAISCGPFIRVLQSLLVFALFIVAAFATLRVYAIWHRSWALALPVLMLALVPPAINIYLDINQRTQIAPPPSAGCAVSIQLTGSLYSHLVIVNRSTTIAYDAIVLLLTFMRTLGVRRRAMNAHEKTDIVHLIVRDGTLYFVALMVINIAQIIITSEVAGNNYLSYYVSPITSVLISRFLLDLRHISDVSDEDRANDYASLYLTSDFPSAHFTDKYMGGLNGPLATFMSETDSTESRDTGTEVEPCTPMTDRPLLSHHLHAFHDHGAESEGSTSHMHSPIDHDMP